jgi:hypothetical protein
MTRPCVLAVGAGFLKHGAGSLPALRTSGRSPLDLGVARSTLGGCERAPLWRTP